MGLFFFKKTFCLYGGVGHRMSVQSRVSVTSEFYTAVFWMVEYLCILMCNIYLCLNR